MFFFVYLPNLFVAFSSMNETSTTIWQSGKKAVIRNNTSHNLQTNSANANSKTAKGNLENESGISSMASNNEEQFDDNEDSSIESLSDSEQSLSISNMASENGQSSKNENRKNK
jgi:hypothetical protein